MHPNGLQPSLPSVNFGAFTGWLMINPLQTGLQIALLLSTTWLPRRLVVLLSQKGFTSAWLQKRSLSASMRDLSSPRRWLRWHLKLIPAPTPRPTRKGRRRSYHSELRGDGQRLFMGGSASHTSPPPKRPILSIGGSRGSRFRERSWGLKTSRNCGN